MLRKLFLYFAILFGSVIFFSIFVLIFLNGTAVVCTQQADQSYTCKIQTLLLGKFPASAREIDQVVDVDTFDDGCFDGCAYRTEFIMADGTSVPLTEVYTDAGPVRKQTSELRSLLNSGQPSFEYHRQPLWWVAFLIGGLFIMEFVILTVVMGGGAIRDYLKNRDKPV